jgi:hypothetical protein
LAASFAVAKNTNQSKTEVVEEKKMQEHGYQQPPIPSAHQPNPYGGGQFVNTSGQGVNAVIPPEIATGFNWGAFLMNWIWGIGHSVWIALVALVAGFIPVIGGLVSLGMCVYLGMKGNELAWRNRRFESVEQFQAVQKAWMKWGLILLGVSILLGLLMVPVFMRAAQEAARQNPAAFQPQ